MKETLNQIRKKLDTLLTCRERVIVAIDGNCTSGKTTLAGALAELYDCNVFHMDDFFLRPGQRTPERLAQPGGNVDYERFWQEVLLPLKTGEPFAYSPYDCATGTLRPPVTVTPKRINVIEGSYSHHPYFGQPYDLQILLKVSPERQKERILQRPAFLHKRFFEEWIPLEKRYFAEFDIAAGADLVLTPADNQ